MGSEAWSLLPRTEFWMSSDNGSVWLCLYSLSSSVPFCCLIRKSFGLIFLELNSFNRLSSQTISWVLLGARCRKGMKSMTLVAVTPGCSWPFSMPTLILFDCSKVFSIYLIAISFLPLSSWSVMIASFSGSTSWSTCLTAMGFLISTPHLFTLCTLS